MSRIISVQPLVTKTATFDGGSVAVDNGVFPTVPDWTLVLQVQASGPDTQARFQFTDSVNAFVTTMAGPQVEVTGGVSAEGDLRWTFTRRDFPDLRFSMAGAVLRLSLVRLTGTSPTISYAAWLEV